MPTSRIVAWTVALRTRIIDDYIQAAISSGVDTVLSLALDWMRGRIACNCRLRCTGSRPTTRIIEYRKDI